MYYFVVDVIYAGITVFVVTWICILGRYPYHTELDHIRSNLSYCYEYNDSFYSTTQLESTI